MHFYVTQLYLVPHSRKTFEFTKPRIKYKSYGIWFIYFYSFFLFFSFLFFWGVDTVCYFCWERQALTFHKHPCLCFIGEKKCYKGLEMRVSKFLILINMYVPWESNPQPFALLTQCSTTEPHSFKCVHPFSPSLPRCCPFIHHLADMGLCQGKI